MGSSARLGAIALAVPLIAALCIASPPGHQARHHRQPLRYRLRNQSRSRPASPSTASPWTRRS